MAKSDLTDVRNNDLSRNIDPYGFGPAERSENNPTVPLPGSGGIDDGQATPQAQRAGYGHQYLGPNNDSLSNAPPSAGLRNAGGPVANSTTPSKRAATGGHNMDARGQYTVKMPRGSSL